MEISQSTRYESSPLVSIQALRAIAALLVFWGHAINAVHLKIEADFPHLYGPFGVDLFFVISGFVMVYSSERLFGQPGAPITFFVRRLARIVPLYWLATTVLVWFVVPYASTKAVLGSLFFAPHIPSEAPPSLRRMDTDLRNVLLCRVCNCTAWEAAFRGRGARHNFSDLFLRALGA
jgi:Acyltransferase family